MHPSPSDASPVLPAFVLALALLGVLTAVGGQVFVQMRMAPGTLMSPGAEAAVANPNSARPQVTTSMVAPAALQVESGPGWETLTTPQKLALYPLSERWVHISETQKRRWLTLAVNFPTLSPAEQNKFLDRITDWASLSAQQRNQARLNYAVTNRLARDDKRAQWEAYQALSDSERRALASRAAPKPTGAATALRPIPRRKLAQVPAATENPNRPNAPKIPSGTENAHRAIPVAIPPLAPPSAGIGAHQSGSVVAPSPGVETAPVTVPTAVPAALPPLAQPASPAASTGAASPLPVTPDTSGVYPQ